MKIVVRHAVDDFQSLLIANAMESVGVSVFSVCKNRQDIQTRRFIVWGKYDGDDSILEIMDKAISKELYGEEEESA